MLEIQIPRGERYQIKSIVLDYNGTLAVYGKIKEELKEQLIRLSKVADVYVVTADTYGTVQKELAGIPIQIRTFLGECAAREKRNIVMELGAETVLCIGNGFNDREMLKEAALSFIIAGKEGFYAPLLYVADIVFPTAEDALEALLKKEPIIATLRG